MLSATLFPLKSTILKAFKPDYNNLLWAKIHLIKISIEDTFICLCVHEFNPIYTQYYIELSKKNGEK